jgi:hypothetical protein
MRSIAASLVLRVAEIPNRDPITVPDLDYSYNTPTPIRQHPKIFHHYREASR